MVSRIVRLELPLEDHVAGFDSTIEDDNTTFTMSSSLAAIAVGRSLRTSIATHALAHEHSVCGLNADSTGWTWTTSLAPHRVCQVASNASGDLIAATLDNGTLSILRGTDGTVLATRRVAPEGTRLAASVEFVQHHESVQSCGDTLIILPPEEGPPILVSNMHGKRLNAIGNAGVVAEAARSMGLHALHLPDCEDIRAMRGVSMTDHVIRLAVVDGDGRLAVYDYNLHEKKSILVQRDVDLTKGGEDTSWEIDLEVGLRVQEVPISESKLATFLLLSLYKGSRTKICWLSLQELTVACEYLIPLPLLKSVNSKRARILAMETVHSCASSQALAVVLGIKLPSDKAPHLETRIIQAVVKEVMEEIFVEQAHPVYSIPVPPSVQSMSVARIAQNLPYSFLCKTWSGEKSDCYLFTTPASTGISVGSIRLLCAQDEFEQAQNSLIESQDESLVQDPFAGFHSSEITVKRLERLLDAGSLATANAMTISQSCMQQLVQGALSGNSLAKRAFLTIADRILNWPDEKALQNPPFLQEVVAVLEGMIAAMSGVGSAFDDKFSDEFTTKSVALKERLQVVRYLQETLQSSGQASVPIHMTKAFEDVRTFKDLFATLVKHGYFDNAENLSRSNLRSKLSAESMASSILSISPSVNPHQFSNLLMEVIFPSLSIGHELLPPILAWSCKMADAYDVHGTDNENTLDDAIFLLESTERATKDLRLRLHSSFATYTPFVERAPKRRQHDSSHTSIDVTSTEASFASLESASNSVGVDAQVPPSGDMEFQRPNPTILEIGRLKGGARKTRVVSQLTPESAVDENEDIVELKLASARCLKYARALGLDSHSLSLGTFAQCGGAQHIAKQLVKKFSNNCVSHEKRAHNLCEIVRPFCESTLADFDEALFSYVRDLCGGKTATRSKIEEAASIARCCSSVGTRCQVTLVTLRAALFCRFSPKWLSELSLEAIEWAAGDSSLRSELEEASRLLLIDGIVGVYCGEGAKELFHVDNPRHAIRLLQFVARKFDHDAALTDSLNLCDAFAHLSREDACSNILENAILYGDAVCAPGRLLALYKQNVVLAKATFSRVIPFCVDLIEEAAAAQHVDSSKNERFAQLVQCGQGLATVALSNIHFRASTERGGFSGVYYDEKTLEKLVLDFKRLSSLQKDHFVCLTLSSIHDPKILVKTIVNMLRSVTDAYLTGNPTSSGTEVTRIKRACAILSGCSNLSSSDLWYAAVGSSACRLAMKSTNLECLKFMSDLGMFEVSQHFLASRTCLAVSLAFCLKASKLTGSPGAVKPAMKHIIMALSLLQDHALLKCPLDLLDKTISVAELCDVITQVFNRSDEGIGEELDAFQKSLRLVKFKESSELKPIQPRIRRSVLHPDWYVGDGLLLPPSEILVSALKYCKQTLQFPTLSDAALSLHSFVDSRGAYGLGLRLLAVTAAARMSSFEEKPSFISLQDAGKRTIVSLAERYVGGTSNGFTSGGVDSQMAVSLLLCLPLKMAFSVYKSSLPTAISTRDFSRVITLANVGAAAGSGRLFPNSSQPLQQWARQQNLVVQCRELALRAKWWKQLQEFSVPFDTHRFQDSSQSSKEKTKPSGQYVASLLPIFICNLSWKVSDPKLILEILLEFAESFGLPSDVPVQKYVEFLLAPPESEVHGMSKNYDDIRMKLGSLDEIVKSLLRQLDCPKDRALILRSCLCRLEEPATSREYERFSVVLSLYHAELSGVLSNATQDDLQKGQSLELELIDRRRDALAILSWFFQNDLYEDRPAFSDLFVPLPQSWDADYSKNTRQITLAVLGTESKTQKGNVFDPLQALDHVLRSSKGIAAASALAPLSLPLGVPRGYIHARCLISRFKKSVVAGAALPSFADDVLPTLNRLQLSDDIADMAEWCALQYQYEDEDKLHCLDHALNFAIKASSESEARCSRTSGGNDIPELSAALDRVKRITGAKDMLADRLSVNAILKSAHSGMGTQNSIGEMVKALINILDTRIWARNGEFVPERFVEVFIEEASRISSEGCLSHTNAISLGQVRAFSKIVNRAATALADKYSHVQVHAIAHRLIRRWFLHGDTKDCAEYQTLDFMTGSIVSENFGEKILPDIDEDDTMNFVMDLDSLQQANDFSASSQLQDHKLTSEEEPNIFSDKGSAREFNESESRRVSLRIAFALAFLGEDPLAESDRRDVENHEPANKSTIKPSRLRAKLSANGRKQPSDTVFDHCRQLLRIVFAKSAPSSGLILRDLNASIDSRSFGGSSIENTKHTITFAMRHRALRVASILCPQNALEHVIDEDELLKESQSTLTKSAFAVFVAKEIEEMGLPLPHADLAQLSTMHFPSYARALWRHHREEKRPLGRLLLLILEMYLMEEVSDLDFFLSILSEMDRLSLPRTLLSAFDCIHLYLDRIGPEKTAVFLENTCTEMVKLAQSLASRVIQELKSVADGPANETTVSVSVEAITATLMRLSMVLKSFSKTSDGQSTLFSFLNGIVGVMEQNREDGKLDITLVDALVDLVQSSLRHLESKDDTIHLRTRMHGFASSCPALLVDENAGGLETIDEESIDLDSIASLQ